MSIRVHYNQAWVKALGTGAITIGNNIYTWKSELSDSLLRHEMKHVEQYKRYGKVGFLARYLWGWVSNGFRYSKIPLEVEARGEE